MKQYTSEELRRRPYECNPSENWKSYLEARTRICDYMYSLGTSDACIAFMSRILPGEYHSGYKSYTGVVPQQFYMHLDWSWKGGLYAQLNDICIYDKTPFYEELLGVANTASTEDPAATHRQQLRRTTLRTLRNVCSTFFKNDTWAHELYEAIKSGPYLFFESRGSADRYMIGVKDAYPVPIGRMDELSLSRAVTRKLKLDIKPHQITLFCQRVSEYRSGKKHSSDIKHKTHKGGKLVSAYEGFNSVSNVSSCMTHQHAPLGLYKLNPERVSVAVVTKGKKPIARALLWSMDDGTTMLDRIYGESTSMHQLCSENNWSRREPGDSEVTLDVSGVVDAPYMDTLRYGEVDNKAKTITLYKDKRKTSNFVLTSTGGNVEWISSIGQGCIVCGAKSGSNGVVTDTSGCFLRTVYCEKCAAELLRKCSSCGKHAPKDEVTAHMVCNENILSDGYELVSTSKCKCCSTHANDKLVKLKCGHYVAQTDAHADSDMCGHCAIMAATTNQGPASSEHVHARVTGGITCGCDVQDDTRSSIMWSRVTCPLCINNGVVKKVEGAIKRKKELSHE